MTAKLSQADISKANTGLPLDVLEWLGNRRDEEVGRRRKLDAEYSETTMSMAPPDDGTSRYLYELAKEIAGSRDRITLMQSLIQERRENVTAMQVAWADLRNRIVDSGVLSASSMKEFIEACDVASEGMDR